MNTLRHRNQNSDAAHSSSLPSINTSALDCSQWRASSTSIAEKITNLLTKLECTYCSQKIVRQHIRERFVNLESGARFRFAPLSTYGHLLSVRSLENRLVDTIEQFADIQAWRRQVLQEALSEKACSQLSWTVEIRCHMAVISVAYN